MAFFEDPRLRQRWNQISHNAETVTESAAEGIWTFQHRYITPCLGAVAESLEDCTAPCFGDRDERARRSRLRGHHSRVAEYTFDFYDDWDDDDDALARDASYGSSILGGWGGANSQGENWDRLMGGAGGSGARRGNHVVDVFEQPKRKRVMSYGTRGGRRRNTEDEDPTIIPSTAPLGFMRRLPWKIGAPLRYKPSAAFLKDHPGGASHLAENQPLLESDGDGDTHPHITSQMRKRSGTGGSGQTSDSFRSRGDIFPSDGEGDEDAVPLDDEFAMALNRFDDRASNKTRSSKGKNPADGSNRSRTGSRTTPSPSTSRSSLKPAKNPHGSSLITEDDLIRSVITPSLEDLQREEEEAKMQEDQEVVRKREAAAQLARERGLSASDLTFDSGETESRLKSVTHKLEALPGPESLGQDPSLCVESELPVQMEVAKAPPKLELEDDEGRPCDMYSMSAETQRFERAEFVPARLPNFR